MSLTPTSAQAVGQSDTVIQWLSQEASSQTWRLQESAQFNPEAFILFHLREH